MSVRVCPSLSESVRVCSNARRDCRPPLSTALPPLLTPRNPPPPLPTGLPLPSSLRRPPSARLPLPYSQLRPPARPGLGAPAPQAGSGASIQRPGPWPPGLGRALRPALRRPANPGPGHGPGRRPRWWSRTPMLRPSMARTRLCARLSARAARRGRPVRPPCLSSQFVPPSPKLAPNTPALGLAPFHSWSIRACSAGSRTGCYHPTAPPPTRTRTTRIAPLAPPRRSRPPAGLGARHSALHTHADSAAR